MKSHNTSICGLDFQTEYLSVVQYSPEENAVTLVSIQPFSGGADHDEWKQREHELKNIKGRLRFFSPAITCGIPAEYAIVKILMVDAGERNIGEAIRWELSQQMSGPIEEYVFDFQEIEPEEVGSVTKRFLAAAYRRELVSRVAGIMQSVKFEPRGVGLDIFGLVNIFEANYPDKTAAPCLLVHSERQVTKLVLARNGAFLDFHVFEHPTAPQDSLGFATLLADEITRFLATVDTGGGAARGAGVYASGSLYQQADVRDALFEKVRGAEMLNPFRYIKCHVAIDEQQLQQYSAQLAVAVGLALQGCPGDSPVHTYSTGAAVS
jgi:Tfp pilus assembly PilM family ATPase